MHAVAALAGGVVAQEAVKLITVSRSKANLREGGARAGRQAGRQGKRSFLLRRHAQSKRYLIVHHSCQCRTQHQFVPLDCEWVLNGTAMAAATYKM